MATQTKALNQSDVIDLISRLIEIPSVSFNEADIASFLEAYCTDVFGGASVKRDGHSLVISIGEAEAQHRLLLCSHVDTVSPSDGWTKDPFKAVREGGRIYGLGANDALASCVSMLGALSQAQHQIKGNAGVTLALVEQEETGSNGFARIEPSLNYTSAIFGEPTEMRTATEMRGYMRLKLLGKGQSCHASRPWEGKNAIFHLTNQLSAIEQLDLEDGSTWGRATVEPTILTAGNSVNQIPDHAEAILDVRTTPAINNEAILEKLDALSCDYEIIHNNRRPMACDANSEVMQAINTALPGQETFAFGGSCDMAFATKPSIVMGVGKSVRSHAADEFVEEDELVDGVAKYVRVLDRYVELFS